MSRPTSYTPELAKRICDALATCGSLRAVCREPWAPDRSTVARWVTDNTQGFAAEYARAKAIGIDDFVEQTLELADEEPEHNAHGVDSGAVAHTKVRIETRRWLAERMMPSKYGPRSGVDVTSSDGSMSPVDESSRSARVAQLMAAARERKQAEDDFSDLA